VAPNEVLIPPGEVKVAAGVLFDPVATGVEVNVAFAPNVSNVVNIIAQDEYRELFMAVNYSSHPAITTVAMLGNHCDIGGGYDNGIAALTLEAATAFFRNSGLAIGPPSIPKSSTTGDGENGMFTPSSCRSSSKTPARASLIKTSTQNRFSDSGRQFLDDSAGLIR
jgi:hypothetical protein